MAAAVRQPCARRADSRAAPGTGPMSSSYHADVPNADDDSAYAVAVTSATTARCQHPPSGCGLWCGATVVLDSRGADTDGVRAETARQQETRSGRLGHGQPVVGQRLAVRRTR